MSKMSTLETNRGRANGGGAAVRVIHPIAGGIAMLTILCFWIATVASEASGSADLIITVKTLIPWGFLILIPALAAVGSSGFALASGGHGRRLNAKRLRMKVIAVNGLLILVPSAFFLSWKAEAGAFDLAFVIVQALELIAGAVNITLMTLNMRDGFALTGRLRQQRG